MEQLLADEGIFLDLSKVDRATALNAWLMYHTLTKKELAIRLGVSPSAVTRLINGQRRSRRFLRRLVELGVPADLLPLGPKDVAA